MSLAVANWNLEWASYRKASYPMILDALGEGADVACFTEINLHSIPHASKHLITADADYGYKAEASRRKVALVSSEPWLDIQTSDSAKMPGGRYVAGISHGIRFIGVCIPWHAAHVSTGRRDATLWSEHLEYLSALKKVILRYSNDSIPLCVLGDFNQRIPKLKQPDEVYKALVKCFAPLRIHTADVHDPTGSPLIDHLATSLSLEFSLHSFLPASLDGVKLSDHTGYTGILNYKQNN